MNWRRIGSQPRPIVLIGWCKHGRREAPAGRGLCESGCWLVSPPASAAFPKGLRRCSAPPSQHRHAAEGQEGEGGGFGDECVTLLLLEHAIGYEDQMVPIPSIKTREDFHRVGKEAEHDSGGKIREALKA